MKILIQKVVTLFTSAKVHANHSNIKGGVFGAWRDAHGGRYHA